jgi:hypothetical protein
MIKSTTQLFLIALGTLALLHFLLIELVLYWRFLWIDMPMHFFGGTVVALGVFAARDLHIPFFFRISARPSRVVMAVLLVAVAWELFEYLAGISIVEKHFWSDTFSDLALGLCGGIFGTILGNRLSKLS